METLSGWPVVGSCGVDCVVWGIFIVYALL